MNRQKLAGHARNRSHKCGLRLSSLILPAWDLVSRCCFKAFCKGTSNKHSLEWNLEVISAISKHYKFQTFQFYCTMFYAISLSFCLLSSILINPVPGSQRRSRRSRSPGKKMCAYLCDGDMLNLLSQKGGRAWPQLHDVTLVAKTCG